MGGAVLAAEKMSSEEAKARVDDLIARQRASFYQSVINHRFNQELFAGELPREKFVGFLRNWFCFAFEINTTIASLVDRYLFFFQRHQDCYDLIAEKVADEFMHPGPGGHVKMFTPLAKAFGMELADLHETRLIPEARALLDVRCRLLLRGPFPEAIATTLGEGPIGEWLGMIGKALQEHYGLTDHQAQYFIKHYSAVTPVH